MTAYMYAQEWHESERGWGTRPDGYSIHAVQSDVAAYVKAYWDSMPDFVPDEYSRPVGKPFLTEVDDDIAEQALNSKERGVRLYNWSPNSE